MHEPVAEFAPRLLMQVKECFGEGERLMAVVLERLVSVEVIDVD
jgi:hypothetical protein